MSKTKQKLEPNLNERTEAFDNTLKAKKQSQSKFNMINVLKVHIIVIGLCMVFCGGDKDNVNKKSTDNVLHLTDESFDQAVIDNQLMLVYFRDDWITDDYKQYSKVADHFKDQETTWSFLAETFFGVPQLKFAEFLETEKTPKKYRRELEIIGGIVPGGIVPVIKLIKNGQVLNFPYQNESASVMIDKIGVRLRPAVVFIGSNSDLEKVKKKSPVFMVGYFPNGVNKTYVKAAEKSLALFEEVSFYYVDNAQLAEKLGLKSDQVALFKRSEDKSIALKSFLVEADYFDFMFKNKQPLLTDVNTRSNDLTLQSPNAHHVIVLLSKNSDSFEDVVKNLEKVADKFKHTKLVFSYADINDYYYKQNFYCNIQFFNIFAWRVLKLKNNTVYEFNSFSEEVLNRSTVKSSETLLTEKNKNILFPEEIPRTWNDDPLEILYNYRSKSFDENACVVLYVHGTKKIESRYFYDVTSKISDSEKSDGFIKLIVKVIEEATKALNFIVSV